MSNEKLKPNEDQKKDDFQFLEDWTREEREKNEKILSAVEERAYIEGKFTSWKEIENLVAELDRSPKPR